MTDFSFWCGLFPFVVDVGADSPKERMLFHQHFVFIQAALRLGIKYEGCSLQQDWAFKETSKNMPASKGDELFQRSDSLCVLRLDLRRRSDL